MTMQRTRQIRVSMALVLCATMLASSARSLCNGSGQLNPPTTYTVGGSGAGITTADFNEDGILDLATAVASLGGPPSQGVIAVQLGLGAAGVGNGLFGTATPFPAGSSLFGLEAADLNGDGILDLVTSSFGSNAVSVLLGNGIGGVGNGTFAAPAYFPAGPSPHHLVLADFNEDGIQDIAVANNSQFSLSVLIGLGAAGVGNATFSPPVTLAMNNYGTGVTAADVDNDGILDLIGSEYSSQTIAIFRGLGAGGVGNGTFAAATHIGAGPSPYDIEAADFNEDGNIDLVVTNTGGGGLRYLRGTGAGTFISMGDLVPGIMADAEAMDYDGDGILDLFTLKSLDNDFRLLKGNGVAGVGDGTFTLVRQFTVPGFPIALTYGDFNEDGLLDAAMTNYSATTNAVTVSECNPAPVTYRITQVRDVPADQGGRVFVTWSPHADDVPSGPVTGYRVWRRIPAASALRALPGTGAERRATRTASEVVYWEAAATLPAQRLDAYGYTAATAQDSLAGGNPYTAFFITATTADLDIFHDTPVDSGYSVDNLPPLPPSMLSAEYLTNQVRLTWQPNTESDLFGYSVHRGASAGFTPSLGNRIALTGATAAVDPAGTFSSYYRIAAVDVHGNVGAYALVQPSGPVGIELTLLASDPRPGDVMLVWYADAVAMPLVGLERREGDEAWRLLSQGTPDASSRLEFHDETARAGGDYHYRLVWNTATGVQTSSEVGVRVPALALSLSGAWPHPAPASQVSLRITLPDASPATISLYDPAGRRVAERSVGGLGAGTHTVSLASSRLTPGVYLARLSQHGDEKRMRVVVVQ